MDQKKLNKLLRNEDGGLTIKQFLKKLRKTLGADAPLVKQLDDWESKDYEPGQLLSLRSVLRDEVTTKRPHFGKMEDTAKLLDDDRKKVKSLRAVARELLTAQQLHRWVANYEKIYKRALKSD
jgi:hypothetical protein